MRALGKRLARLRAERGLSRREVAVALGIPVSSYRDLEYGAVPRTLPKLLPALARTFSVPIATLLGGTPGNQTQAAINHAQEIQTRAKELVDLLVSL